MYTAAPKKQVGRVALPTFVRRRKGGDSEFVEIPIGEKKDCFPPHRSLNATECDNCRKTPSNLYFFCWKLSSGHLNVRAEGSRRGGKKKRAYCPRPASAKRRVAPPSAVGGEGAIEQAGAVQEGGRRRRKKTLFFCILHLRPRR